MKKYWRVYMPINLELLKEAYNRGILPENKKALYNEAVKRGLISDSDLPDKISDKSIDFQGMSKSILDQYNSGQQEASEKPMSVASMSGSGGLIERPQQPQPEQPPVPQWFQDSPNLYGAYGASKAILEKVVTPVVEGVSTMAGGIVGSAAGPGGAIAGSALTYGASKKVMDLVEDYYSQLGGAEPKERTVTGELKGSAKDVALIAATGAIFEGTVPVLRATSNVLFDTLPQRLYSSAFKMPLKKSWISTKPWPGDISKRTAATEEGLRSGTGHSKLALAEAKTAEKEMHTFIDDVTKTLSENPSNKIELNKIVARGLKRAYSEASTGYGKKEKIAIIKEIRDTIKRDFGDTITPYQANQLKRSLYKEVKWNIGIDPIIAKGKKGVAHELMAGLEKLYPSIKQTNATWSAKMDLIEALEMSLARTKNSNIIPLSTKVLAGHPELAVIEGTFAIPGVKARTAIWLAKLNPGKYSKFIYPEKPLGYTPPVAKIEKEVYRYMPEVQYVKSTVPKPQVIVRKGEPRVDIKTQSELNREAENAAIAKAVDMAFAKQASMVGSKGPQLSLPKTDYVKSTIPSIKTTLQPAEIKQKIKTKVMERIEKEEAIRTKHLEMRFAKQEASKKKTGPPLALPRNDFVKSTIPPSVEDRLKQWR
jgi:hypothetical protein